MRTFKVELTIRTEDFDENQNAISKDDIANIVTDGLVRIDKIRSVTNVKVVEKNRQGE